MSIVGAIDREEQPEIVLVSRGLSDSDCLPKSGLLSVRHGSLGTAARISPHPM